jgi:hypothetical protein
VRHALIRDAGTAGDIEDRAHLLRTEISSAGLVSSQAPAKKSPAKKSAAKKTARKPRSA